MILSAIVFLTALFFSSVSGFFTQIGRYDELQRLGNPCFPMDTCQSLNELTEDNLWRNRTCECGDHCVRHQTCCIDSRYYGIEQLVPKRSEKLCQEVQTRDFSVYMVSTCLQGWHMRYVYEKCVNPEPGLKDPLSQVPVTSIASMTSYRNLFCAICNNDAGSAVLWNIRVIMPKNLILPNNAIMTADDIIERMEYNSERNSWGFLHLQPQTRKQQFMKTQIMFSVKEDLNKFVKPCHPRIISKCHPSYKSTRLHYKCQAYYSPITGRKQGSEETLNYRNIHCALCNGLRANIDDLRCLLKDDVRRQPSLSFTKLLDVNRNDGDIVGKTSVCKEGHMYDPFFKKCRSLGCAMPNYVMKNGGCVKPE